MSRVAGSIDTGPRGLVHDMPLAASTSAVAAGVAIGLLQRLVDEVHAVIAADREEVRAAAHVGVAIGVDELLVGRIVALERVVEGR